MNPKINKNTALTLSLCSLFFTASFTSLHAKDDPLSANVTIATDYVWRGISQTLENPTIQGGLDWTPAESFYAGVWGSNVDFDGVENMEFDVYGGWATELDNGLGIDLGFIQYLYFDDAADVDFNELYASVSYIGISGKLSYDIDNKNTYIEAGYDYEFANGLTLGAHMGNYSFDLGEDYTDYSVGVSGSFAGLDYGLTYHDTDIDLLAEADARLVFSVGRSF